jgi:putative pyruvate formate lyase activating enzyme
MAPSRAFRTARPPWRAPNDKPVAASPGDPTGVWELHSTRRCAIREMSRQRQYVLDDFEPCYRQLLRDGRLAERARQALKRLDECRLCPRNCGARRTADEYGTCCTGQHALVESAFPHLGEEDCLRGQRGSGTIFFAQCNLHCVFCQNASLSHSRTGEELDAASLAALMLSLQRRGCHNVNLATPSHVVPQIIEAVALAAQAGLALPLVYNSSGYDGAAALALLDGVVDVYMPDLKFWEVETGRYLAGAPDYAEHARNALREMHRQVGVLRFGRDGLARRGVLVRHLVMPGLVDEGCACIEWIARELSPNTYVNVMAQYSPAHDVARPDDSGRRLSAGIDRRPSTAEIEAVHAAARAAGLWRLDQRHHSPRVV